MTSPDPHRETPAGKRRARALGIPFDGVPGPHNAITDVAGVEVGDTTIIANRTMVGRDGLEVQALPMTRSAPCCAGTTA